MSENFTVGAAAGASLSGEAAARKGGRACGGLAVEVAGPSGFGRDRHRVIVSAAVLVTPPYRAEMVALVL